MALALVFVPGSPLRGDDPATAPVKKASFDSEAPVRAPAHWLPPEDWVYNHWLPYDEGRLHSLRGVTRGDIWRQLRDDRHNLAQLAAAHGWPEPGKLAAALVAPRAADVTPAVLATLRRRAERTITQGHLSQHLFFHSLHQFAIPSAAPETFGVTDAAFRRLRRQEQSPLEIGRLHGRSPGRIQALAAGVLRERVRFGVSSGAMSERQGRILLRRQVSQLPRWLAQVRYNCPPPTHAGKLTGKPRDFAANPALSGDGARVVFESYLHYQAQRRAGQSAIYVTDLRDGRSELASRGPRSAPRADDGVYDPAISGDGTRVAFTTAASNLGAGDLRRRTQVFVRDLRARTTTLAFDNAFHLGRERPAVRLRAGGELTWRWRAQQSHQVTLRSGPEPLTSPTKTAGTYAVQLDKPGRYTFVCSIHAPGMRMSAIVR